MAALNGQHIYVSMGEGNCSKVMWSWLWIWVGKSGLDLYRAVVCPQGCEMRNEVCRVIYGGVIQGMTL